MNRLAMVLTFSLLAIAVCIGQSAAATQPDGSTGGKSMHGVITVSLAKSIDSKKLKEGDEIPPKTLGTIRTSDGDYGPERVDGGRSRDAGDGALQR